MSSNEAKSRALLVWDNKSFNNIEDSTKGAILDALADLADLFPRYFDFLTSVTQGDLKEYNALAQIETVNPRTKRVEFRIIVDTAAFHQVSAISTFSTRIRDIIRKAIYHEFAHMIDILEANFAAGLLRKFTPTEVSSIKVDSDDFGKFNYNMISMTFGKTLYSYASDFQEYLPEAAYSMPNELFADMFAAALLTPTSPINNRFRCWLLALETQMWQFSEAFTDLVNSFMKGENRIELPTEDLF